MRRMLIAAALALSASAAMAQSTIRIGLQDDIGTLDPARSVQFVDRIVFASLCNSLVDVTPDLKIVPMLATSWTTSADGKSMTFKLRQGVKFQNDEPFNAAAVKANLDRYRSLPTSNRKSELSSVDHVDVVDDNTVTIVLKEPNAALLATLSDRAGMMLAPKTFADAAGVASHPVCSGPYKFVQRVQNDRIVLEKFAGYWDADKYPIQRVVFQPIPDSTVRLANLRSGSLDMMERVAPSDVNAVKSDSNLQLKSVTGLGTYYFTFNIANGPRGANGPFKDKRVRQAFDLAIDRQAIDQVIGAGIYPPANQGIAQSSPYYDKSLPFPKRDIAKAKALLKAAGQPNPTIEFTYPNNTIASQITQMIQAMVSEAGITLKLRPTDYAAALNAAHNGDFQAMYMGWSGRVDPDGNMHQFYTCEGNLNYAKYCNPQVDKLLNDARVKQSEADRKALYDQATKIVAEDPSIVYLYAQPWPFVMSKKVQGFAPSPDGLVRLRGVSIKG
ncbi:ABC transporter substrate-binding protein [Paraburkholderia sabiae]|uniref:ABC transporter substrate-binding protein n=1 Tax=Paraburkholderia sabiae TaxID=273251 RepID=A0ABU9Q917_9BURK|nr:ABC transporter substrate-binding protein [Paraburkholderia sabiae]WJZ78511.1 ABC transporter substrate-binding protein [Paraburkholderia sabiae]CAD6509407.1 Glutathione-binding protein GsiB [Paraburkholderia sabiae]CAG9206053.1 Putative glutathione transporter,solute-binding component [Paraburkholderia sabiae]